MRWSFTRIIIEAKFDRNQTEDADWSSDKYGEQKTPAFSVATSTWFAKTKEGDKT